MRLRSSLVVSTLVGALSYAILARGRIAAVGLLESAAHLGIWWQLVLRPFGAAAMLSAGIAAGALFPGRWVVAGILAGVFGEISLATSEFLFPMFPLDSQVTPNDVVAYFVSPYMISRLGAAAIFGLAGGALAVALRSNYRIERAHGP